jgi:hypothetical protein
MNKFQKTVAKRIGESMGSQARPAEMLTIQECGLANFGHGSAGYLEAIKMYMTRRQTSIKHAKVVVDWYLMEGYEN